MPSIAILGASANRNKFGNKAVRAYLRQGWDVYPINLRERVIEGLKVYRSLAELPVPALDRVSVYLPPQIGKQVLPELLKKSIGEIWFNPGSADEELLEIARELGLNVAVGCSLLDSGQDPSLLP